MAVDLIVRPSGPIIRPVNLRPVHAVDEDILKGLALTDYRCRLTRWRSLPHHNLYWGTLTNVLRSSHLGDRYPTVDHLHQALKVTAGYATELVTLDGQVLQVPDSTSFSAMDQTAFRAFFDRAMAILAAEIGCDPLALGEAA